MLKAVEKLRKRNEGIALIWAAVAMLVLVAFVGLAVDFGLMVWTAEQLQIAADGAALAGAQWVRDDESLARDQAQLVGAANKAGGVFVQLERNEANDPNGDIIVGRFDRDTGTFDPDGFVNAVKVNARRTDASLNGALPLHFARIMGFNETDIQRSAIAILGGGTGTGMLILDNDDDCALTIRGNPTIELDDGAIQVNSTSGCGTCIQGDPTILATEINMVGDACLTGVTEDQVPDLNPNSDEIPDPLALLPDPPIPSPHDPTSITQSGEYSAGYYPDGINLSGGDVTLQPGIYIIDNGFRITGSTNFYAEGVMFFLRTGALRINGTGELVITPPDPDDPNQTYAGVDTYENVAIFQARTNTAEGDVNGTADMHLEGTYYFPQNKISLGGTANQFGDQFIAWQAELYGNGIIELAVDGSIPAPGGRVFLVE